MNILKRLFHKHEWFRIKESLYRPRYFINLENGKNIQGFVIYDAAENNTIPHFWPEDGLTDNVCVICGKEDNAATKARIKDEYIEKMSKIKREKWFKGLPKEIQQKVFCEKLK